MVRNVFKNRKGIILVIGIVDKKLSKSVAESFVILVGTVTLGESQVNADYS